MNELIIGLAIIYALPAIIAFGRDHPHKVAISVLAILFGWSLLGYAIALIWSLTSFERRPETGPAPLDPNGAEPLELEIDRDRSSGANVVGLRPRRRPF